MRKQLIYLIFLIAGCKTLPVPSATETKKSDPCSLLYKEYDEIEGRTKIRSPLYYPYSIHKTYSGTDTTYYLSLVAIGYTLNSIEKGVIILFQDSSQWKSDAKVEPGVTYGEGWKYSAFISLTKADIAIFKSKRIKKYRLYIYDQDVKDPEEFRLIIDCISRVH